MPAARTREPGPGKLFLILISLASTLQRVRMHTSHRRAEKEKRGILSRDSSRKTAAVSALSCRPINIVLRSSHKDDERSVETRSNGADELDYSRASLAGRSGISSFLGVFAKSRFARYPQPPRYYWLPYPSYNLEERRKSPVMRSTGD